jgi:hypothetical protein
MILSFNIFKIILSHFFRKASPHQIAGLVDILLDEGNPESAKRTIAHVSDIAVVASYYVKIGEKQKAVNAMMATDCARHEKSTEIWRQVANAACAKGEFELAHVCSLELVNHADTMEVRVLMFI